MNMKEVAKLAGVSTSTVSKVINGKDKDISEKTRKKVLEIVETSNYIPYFKYLEKDNLKNSMIGLIIRRNHRERETIVMAAEAAANRHGYQLLIRYIENKAEISECLESMARKKVTGVILDSEEYFPSGTTGFFSLLSFVGSGKDCGGTPDKVWSYANCLYCVPGRQRHYRRI